MIVRAMQDRDLATLRAAISADDNTAASPVLLGVLAQLPRQLTEGRAAAAVACVNDRSDNNVNGDHPVAFAALLVDEHQIILDGVWVDSAFRRRGLARALLAFFRPLWQDDRVVTTLPEGLDLTPMAGLLTQFGFKPNRHGMTWSARAIRRTAGRSSLAPARSQAREGLSSAE